MSLAPTTGTPPSPFDVALLRAPTRHPDTAIRIGVAVHVTGTPFDVRKRLGALLHTHLPRLSMLGRSLVDGRRRQWLVVFLSYQDNSTACFVTDRALPGMDTIADRWVRTVAENAPSPSVPRRRLS